jgi:hypothetical protein
LLTILFFGIFFGGISYGVWRKYQVDHYACYTIAITTRRLVTAKNGPEIEFIYHALGRDYKGYGYDVEKYHIRYPNARYFVKYSNKNPSACEILWDSPVPDSIRIAPDSGWKELP